MIKASVTIYSDADITPEKNRIVDRLDLYLSTLPFAVTENNFNRIRQELRMTLKFPIAATDTPEEYLNPGGKNWNYCKITNTDEVFQETSKTCYYFIVGKRFDSTGAFYIDLEMDVLNTFRPSSSFTFSERTHVLREHKNRFRLFSGVIDAHSTAGTSEWDEVISPASLSPRGTVVKVVITATENVRSYSVSYSGGGATIHVVADVPANESGIGGRYVYAVREIDRYSEGINPTLYRRSEEVLRQNPDTAWNLVYRNVNPIDPADFQNVNPVECLLVPDSPIPVYYVPAGNVTAADLGNDFYYISSATNNGQAVTVSVDGQEIYRTKTEQVFLATRTYWFVIWKDSGNVKMVRCVTEAQSGGLSVTYVGAEETYNSLGLECAFVQGYVYADANAAMPTSTSPVPTSGGTSITTPTSATALSASIEDIDRTDSRIIKIIKLPYCPAEIVSVSGAFRLDLNWEFLPDSRFFKLNNLSARFSTEFTPQGSPDDPANALQSAPQNPKLSDNRNDQNESKMFNSAFYRPKIVYDSFGKDFRLEEIDNGKNRPFRLSLGFAPTSTVNSRFLFFFRSWFLDYLRFTDEDYPGYLPIARNNEVVLYNSAYLNYIRNGYNYDVKAKERSQLSSILGGGAAILGGAASVGMSVLSGNPLGVVTGSASIATGFMNAANAIAQSEDAIQSKLAQAKAQAVNVSGADDLDLLEVYSGNRAKLCYYEASERMKSALCDLFHFCGYSTDEYKVPDLETRVWFNFIQAEISISSSVNMAADVREELMTKYAQGVTVFHYNSGAWDFEQEKENYERNLME